MPPLSRKAQAVQPARTRLRWRWWWVTPLLGLAPVLFAAVLASEGRFGAPSGPRVASAPPATSNTVSATAVATVVTSQAQPTPTPSSAPATKPAPQATAAAVATAPPLVAAQPAPQASAPQPEGASASGPFRAYRVQSGDTVRFVAEMYGVSPASIAQASGLLNADQLSVGQVLTIPKQPGWLYRVQSGETLDQIAARTGVATAAILSVSQLPSDFVRAGDVILIPDQTLARAK